MKPGTTEPAYKSPRRLAVDSKVIETCTDEPGRPKWTQGVLLSRYSYKPRQGRVGDGR